MEEGKEIISKIKILIAGGYGIYSPLCGEIPLERIKIWNDEEIAVKTIEPSEILLFDRYGHFKYSQNSEAVSDGILLFPSKELQDWNKVFDIGDVLVDDYYIRTGFFAGYTDNDKTSAKLRFVNFRTATKSEWIKETVYSTKCLRKTFNNNFAKMVSRHYGIDFYKGMLLESIDNINDDRDKINYLLEKIMSDDKLKQSFLDYVRGKATEEDTNNFINRFKRDEK